ncbi:porin, partial [Herbiconiux daphne]
MKKAILLSSVALALFSTGAMAANVYKDATSSVDVYGYAKGAHVFNQKAGKNGFDKSEAQIGVKAKQQLNDQFALFGQYEGEYDVNDTSARHWHNRKAFGGIDAGEYGALSAGRQQGVLYNVIGMTDMHPEVVSGWSSAPDKGLFGRADSVIQYQNKVGDYTVTGQYKLETTQSLETG